MCGGEDGTKKDSKSRRPRSTQLLFVPGIVNCDPTTMSEEEHDYNIETADAGASTVIPMEAGQIKKGGYVTLNEI